MQFRIDHERYAGCRYSSLAFERGQWVLEYADASSDHAPERLTFDSREQWRAFVTALETTHRTRDRALIESLDGDLVVAGLGDKCMRITQAGRGMWMDWEQWQMTLGAATAAIAKWEQLRPVAQPLPTSLSQSLLAPRVAVAA